jgi:hypothetical protein
MRHANVSRLLVLHAPRVAARLRPRAPPPPCAAAAKPPGGGGGRPAHRPQAPPATGGITVRTLQRLWLIAACYEP